MLYNIVGNKEETDGNRSDHLPFYDRNLELVLYLCCDSKTRLVQINSFLEIRCII